MAKTISVAGLGHGGASKAIRDAQLEPVLVSKENRPEAWIINAEKLAEVAEARGPEAAATYEQALELLAVELYQTGTLTISQGAKLAGLALVDFIWLCGRLKVPALWESETSPAAEVDSLEEFLARGQAGN